MVKLTKQDIKHLFYVSSCYELVFSNNVDSYRRLHRAGLVSLRKYNGMFHTHAVKPLPAGREYLSEVFRERSRRWFSGL